MAVALAAAVLGGCSKKTTGGSAGSSSPSPPVLPTPAPTGTVPAPFALGGTVKDLDNVDLRPEGRTASILLAAYDDVYGPTFVRAAPGATVKVFLQNRGSVTHSFTIDSLHIDLTLNKGQAATVDVIVPASGSVAYYCRFHKALGMQGAFYVTAVSPTPTPKK